jgi:hypothetical protein
MAAPALLAEIVRRTAEGRVDGCSANARTSAMAAGTVGAEIIRSGKALRGAWLRRLSKKSRQHRSGAAYGQEYASCLQRQCAGSARMMSSPAVGAVLPFSKR